MSLRAVSGFDRMRTAWRVVLIGILAVGLIFGPGAPSAGGTIDHGSSLANVNAAQIDNVRLAQQSVRLVEGSDGTTTYVSFEGNTYEMAVWKGEHVALLTPPQTIADSEVMANLLQAFDAGYEYYQSTTGVEPSDNPATTIDGLSTISIVTATCGAGCGYLGSRGVEILSDWFGSNLTGDYPRVLGFYDTMRDSHTITSIVFYELGRNFWFYSDQLGDYGFTTGYAVINRYFAGHSSGLPFDGSEIAESYENVTLPTIAATYFNHATATGLSTLGQSLGIDNSTGFNGTADLAAALFRILREHAGPDGYAQFWHLLPFAPSQHSASDAFANFVDTAEPATGMDYSFLFKSGWAFEVGTSGNDTLNSPGATHDPNAVLGFYGNDRLVGSSRGDSLFGDAGNDRLQGNKGDDQLAGGTGADVLEGGGGRDILTGGEGRDRLSGGGGPDTLIGGRSGDRLIGSGGRDVFRYPSTSDSTGASFDTLVRADFDSTDRIDLTVNVTDVDLKVAAGHLSTTSFDTDLAAAVRSAQLHPYHAVLFQPSAGDLSATTFLVVDANGQGGYQAGWDFVFLLKRCSTLAQLDATDFI